MDGKLKKLKFLVMLKTINKLLEWDKDGKVTWCYLLEEGGAKHSKLADFKKIDAALSNDGVCSITISLFCDGTAVVGWNTHAQNEYRLCSK